jgi:hypothetical protein
METKIVAEKKARDVVQGLRTFADELHVVLSALRCLSQDDVTGALRTLRHQPR